MARRQDSAATVEHGPEVIGSPRLDVPDIDRHPGPQGTGLAPFHWLKGPLGLSGGFHRAPHVGEDRVEAVPDPLHHSPSGALNGLGDDPVIRRGRLPHVSRTQLPQDRRVLDVGEEEHERLHPRLGLQDEGSILPKDLSLQFSERRGGVDPELLRQDGPGLLVGAQRFGLPA